MSKRQSCSQVSDSSSKKVKAVVDTFGDMNDKFDALAKQVSDLPVSITNPIVAAINDFKTTVCDKLDILIATISEKNFCKTSNFPDVNMETHQQDPKEIDDKLEKLRFHKNNRNDAFYKKTTNKTRADAYEKCLNQTPILIPRKLHECIDIRDAEPIKQHKNDISVQNLKNEISKLRLHENIHSQRVLKYEELASSLLNSIDDETKKEKYKANYEKITQNHDTNVLRKSKDKSAFFCSEMHTVKLGSIVNRYQRNNAQNKSYAAAAGTSMQTTLRPLIENNPLPSLSKNNDQNFQQWRKHGRFRNQAGNFLH